eukprot:TRINITY_DN1111_c0_g1_i1.p1 TRINITY_DN1111_c0_g1~~TRINITY_DN1111_c0_g1_i1.p1  ORF type:complete len:297 (-),score=101.38 TRINITY_DN1111_c0_g1_i1:62-952(-)
MSFNIEVQSAGRTPKTICSVKLTGDNTILDLKKKIRETKKHLYPERQSLVRKNERGQKPLEEEKKLSELGLNENETLFLKDLGTQVAWTTVFLAEYAGPALIYLTAFLIHSLFNKNYNPSFNQKVLLFCWLGHYSKRILETIFVHRFSRATMPISNLFKNCSYYWGAAFAVGYFATHPLYTEANSFQFYFGVSSFVICELVNLYCHIYLSNLRKPGERKYVEPKGLLFDLVVSPNYTFEIFAWVSFSIASNVLTSWLFALVGALQMWVWSIKKRSQYNQLFGTSKKKPTILPFVPI